MPQKPRMSQMPQLRRLELLLILLAGITGQASLWFYPYSAAAEDSTAPVVIPDIPAPGSEAPAVSTDTYVDSNAAEYSPQEAVSSQTVATEPPRNPRVPLFHDMRPAWAFEATAARAALGGEDIVSTQAGATAWAVNLHLGYQPPFFQSLGVLSLGPSVAVYPMGGRGELTRSHITLWSVGGLIEYQARFFRQQPIIPVVGYSVESFHYDFLTGPKGTALLKGLNLGGYLLLNVFEPSGAAEIYVNHGILRSYLVAELRNVSGTGSGTGAAADISGRSLYVGFRLEY